MSLFNEHKLDEMSHILDAYMDIVPTLPVEGKHVLPNGSSLAIDNTQFHKILLGGDQLTVARVRGTQALRFSEEKAVDRLEGVIPLVEDWHTRMTLNKVSYLQFVLTTYNNVFYV